MKFFILTLICSISNYLFCQFEQNVELVYSHNTLNYFDDTLGFIGDQMMIQTNMFLIQEANAEDTTYNSITNYTVTIKDLENKQVFNSSLSKKYSVFHFKYGTKYKITYSCDGYYNKTIILDTKKRGSNKYGYLFPCEIRLYKKNRKNKKQKMVPLIYYHPETDYFDYKLIKKASQI